MMKKHAQNLRKMRKQLGERHREVIREVRREAEEKKGVEMIALKIKLDAIHKNDIKKVTARLQRINANNISNLQKRLSKQLL